MVNLGVKVIAGLAGLRQGIAMIRLQVLFSSILPLRN
jgi:hypothetical protein